MIGATSEIIEPLYDWERLAEPKTEFQWGGRAMRNIRHEEVT